MGSIVLLDEHTVNKIAAGEVVDRPSSIVKELVENSIDAKATSVTVEIKKGGISYIRITDNGIGFSSDDIELAFERHATSKIRKEEDLLHITSMGFRGEALASVAAISKVTLTTKHKDEEIGKIAKVEAGKILSIEPTAAVTGTKIEIRDVFFNVPARFKFLKKDYTEAGYIEDVMIRIALANPHVSFKYINNGKTVLQTSGKPDLKSTIYDIFGKEIYQNVIPVDYEMNDIKIKGMIGLPVISRSTRTQQFTFINSRYIKDKTINMAIDKACEQKYAINKKAFLVLNMQIDPSHIDVNVHPAKLEVKFDDESKVFDSIFYAIRTTLENNEKQNSPFTNIRKEELENRKIEQISKDLLNNGMLQKNYMSSFSAVKSAINENVEGVQEQENNITKKFDFSMADERFASKVKNENRVEENKNESNNKMIEIPKEENTIQEMQNTIYQVDRKSGEFNVESVDNPNNETVEDVENKKGFVNPEFHSEGSYEEVDVLENNQVYYRYIGQVFDTYIVIQIKDKMYIIDQHAAHERLLFEQFKEAYYAKDTNSQLLLIPILVELTTKEKQIVDQNLEMFEKSGFIIEEFGENTIKISGVPNVGYDIEYQSMFKDIIDDLLGASKTENSEKEFRFIATLACKAAVKGRMKLDTKEQIALIDKMVKLENPFTCPHGRPTAYEISKYEIERKFLRK